MRQGLSSSPPPSISPSLSLPVTSEGVRLILPSRLAFFVSDNFASIRTERKMELRIRRFALLLDGSVIAFLRSYSIVAATLISIEEPCFITFVRLFGESARTRSFVTACISFTDTRLEKNLHNFTLTLTFVVVIDNDHVLNTIGNFLSIFLTIFLLFFSLFFLFFDSCKNRTDIMASGPTVTPHPLQYSSSGH